MTIAFDTIPTNILVPLFWAETRPAQAPYNASLRLLLIGRKVAGGTATVNTPYILSEDTVARLFGRGSMLLAMYRAARKNAPFAEIWGIDKGVGEDPVAATGSITVTGAPSAANSGVLAFTVGGRPYQVTVRSTHTIPQVASLIIAAINRDPDRYVNAAVDAVNTAKVNLTVRWAGTSGGWCVIVIDRTGEVNLAMRMISITQMQGGLAEGNIGAALAGIGDQVFDVIVFPYGNKVDYDLMDAFMDHESGRWSPYQQLYGHGVTAHSGLFAGLVNVGLLQNGPHVSSIGVYATASPPWDWAAALGAVMAQYLNGPPAVSRPLQGLPLRGVIPSHIVSTYPDIVERQSLLDAGISTFTVDPDGTVRINRIVTMRKTNVWGSPDASWRDVNTLFQASYFIRSMRAAITGTFPRAALTDQDSGIAGFASPGQIRDVIIHEYKRLESLGLVENHELFTSGLVVERDTVEANRVNILMRPDVVNQLVVIATLVETHLQLEGALIPEEGVEE